MTIALPKLSILYFVLHCSFILSCGLRQSEQSDNVVHDKAQETAAEREVRDQNEILDDGYVLLRTDRGSPVRIRDLTGIGRKYDFEEGANVELENVGKTNVVRIKLGLSAPPKCLAYYNSGDLVWDAEVGVNANDPLPPSEKRLLHVSHEYTGYLRSLDTYRRQCPSGERQPIIYVWEVGLADGTKWEKNPNPE